MTETIDNDVPEIAQRRNVGRSVGRGIVAALATATGLTLGNLVGREAGGYDSVIQFSAGGAALGLAGGLAYLKYAADHGKYVAKGAVALFSTLIGTGIGLEAGIRSAPPQHSRGEILTSRAYREHIARSGEYGAVFGAGAGALGIAACNRKKK